MTTTITPEALELAQVAYSRALTGPGSHVRGLEAAIIAALPELLAAQPPHGMTPSQLARRLERGEKWQVAAQPASSAGGHEQQSITARVCGITPGMSRVTLQLGDRIPDWADLGCIVALAAPVAGEAAQRHTAESARALAERAVKSIALIGPLAKLPSHVQSVVQSYAALVARSVLLHDGGQPAPAAVPVDGLTGAFLADVVTAAGLLRTGHRSKALADRISDKAYQLRSTLNPPQPAAQGVDLERAIDIMWTWQSALGGHVYDGRDVARTLTAPDMESIGVNPDVLIGVDRRGPAIVVAKREIIRALTAQHQQKESGNG